LYVAKSGFSVELVVQYLSKIDVSELRVVICMFGILVIDLAIDPRTSISIGHWSVLNAPDSFGRTRTLALLLFRFIFSLFDFG
jgi:hypothetical protein